MKLPPKTNLGHAPVSMESHASADHDSDFHDPHDFRSSTIHSMHSVLHGMDHELHSKKKKKCALFSCACLYHLLVIVLLLYCTLGNTYLLYQNMYVFNLTLINAAISSSISKAVALSSDAQAQISSMNVTYIAAMDHLDQFKLSIMGLNTSIADLFGLVNEIEVNTKTTLNSSLSNNTKVLMSYMNELSILNKTILAIKTDIATSYLSDISQLQSSVFAVNESQQLVENTLNLLNETISAPEGLKTRITEIANAVSLVNQSYDLKIGELGSVVNGLQSDLGTFNTTILDISQLQSSMSSSVQILNGTISSSLSAINGLYQADINDIKSSLGIMNTSLEHAKVAMNTINGLNETLLTIDALFNNEISQIKLSLISLESLMQTGSLNVSAAVADMSELRSSIQTVSSSVQILNGTFLSSLSEMDVLYTNKLSDLYSSVSVLNNTLNVFDVDAQQMFSKLNLSVIQTGDTMKILNGTISTIKTIFGNDISQMQLSLSSLDDLFKNGLVNVSSEFDEKLALLPLVDINDFNQLQALYTSLNTSVVDLRALGETLNVTADIAQLTSSVSSINSAYNQINVSLTELEKLMKLTVTTDTMEILNQTLLSSLVDISQLQSTLQIVNTSTVKVDAMNMLNETLSTSLSDISNLFTNEISNLQSSVSVINDTLIVFDGKFSSLNASVMVIGNTMETLNHTLSLQAVELAELGSALSLMNTTLTTEISAIAGSLDLDLGGGGGLFP